MLVYLAIVAAFCVIYPFVPRKYIKWLFLALVVALSVMAFFVVPEGNSTAVFRLTYIFLTTSYRLKGFSYRQSNFSYRYKLYHIAFMMAMTVDIFIVRLRPFRMSNGP